MDIRDGAIDFLIESYKEMLPSLGDYVTSPGGNVNLLQADVILGRVGEIEDEVFRRKKGSEDMEEKRRAGYQKNPNRGPGGIILPPKDRAKAEAENMVKMVQSGLVTIPLPSRPNNTYRSEHPATLLENQNKMKTTTVGTIFETKSSVEENKEAAMKLKGSILGKRRSTTKDPSLEVEVAVEVEVKVESESELFNSSPSDKKRKSEDGNAVSISTAENVHTFFEKTENTNDDDEDKVSVKNEDESDVGKGLSRISILTPDNSEEFLSFENGIKTEIEEEAINTEIVLKIEPLSELEKLRAKEDIKRRMKTKEGEMIDGYKKSLQDKVCLHEAGWKKRFSISLFFFPYNRSIISLSNYIISHEKCLLFYFTDFTPISE